jgi:two-component system alkaline phosphatase synthesis response regulator PhoP
VGQNVLVVEDEQTLSRLLTYNLEQEGYCVHHCNHGVVALQRIMDEAFDLIMLDIMLPGMNGFDVLTKMRQRGIKTPVIVLTARNAEADVVQGLKLGADDYMTKPFGVAELLARVAAVMRRMRGGDGEAVLRPGQERVITIGGVSIFPERYEVTIDGEAISLRPKEFEVLQYMAQRPGVVVTRDDLMNIVWGFDYVGGQRTVDVHVSTLRKKLENNPYSVRIESIRGVGYKLVQVRKALIHAE